MNYNYLFDDHETNVEVARNNNFSAIHADHPKCGLRENVHKENMLIRFFARPSGLSLMAPEELGAIIPGQRDGEICLKIVGLSAKNMLRKINIKLKQNKKIAQKFDILMDLMSKDVPILELDWKDYFNKSLHDKGVMKKI
jgi:hypothetical protein